MYNLENLLVDVDLSKISLNLHVVVLPFGTVKYKMSEKEEKKSDCYRSKAGQNQRLFNIFDRKLPIDIVGDRRLRRIIVLKKSWHKQYIVFSSRLFPRGGADTLLLYVVPRFVMYTASALESWANLRKET